MYSQSRIFTDLVGVKEPIVLAPMGGVSGGLLAKAVSEAGGLGLVGASYGNRGWMQQELEIMKTVNHPWGIGLVMFTVAKQMELLDLALSYQPHVIALSFGDARNFIPKIIDSNALAIVQVHEIEQALAAIDAGAGALIVQGAEAGGHSLVRSTLPLVPAVRDAVGKDVPLIAAGGIADGRGLVAALALGANAVMLGTRFLAAEEALPSLAMKEKLIASTAGDTVRTRAFDLVRGINWPEGYSGRALSNAFTCMWEGREDHLNPPPPEISKKYEEAVAKDDLDFRAIWAGEVSDLVNDIRTASAIIEDTITQAQKIITHLV